MQIAIKASLVAAAVVLFTGCWASSERPRNGTPANYLSGNSASGNSQAGTGNTAPANTTDNRMNEEPKKGFRANLPAGFEEPKDAVGQKLLREYGAVFVSRGGAKPPGKVIFRDEGEVSNFQSSLSTTRETIGGHSMELQAAAMTGLKNAIAAARTKSLDITPRAADSAKRTYNETVGLWQSRVDPALEHWTSKGRLTRSDAARIKAMTTFEQVAEVLRLEEQGIYFAKDLSKSIIYSVAPPGTSQHLSLLAFDVAQHDDAEVRRILAENGWFQTVASDLPHFTFLGVKEAELSGLGLKRVADGGRTFWVPDI